MVPVAILKKGFSHLELVIFVLIMAVLIFFSAGVFQKYKQNTVIENFTRTLESDLNNYRSLAMAENIDIEVKFYADHYRLNKEDQIDKGSYYPDNISIDYVRVGFKPSGTAKYAGSIIIKYNEKAVQKITVSPASGLITRKKI